MARKVVKSVVVVAAALFLMTGVASAAWGATSLLFPAAAAFSVLGHSCGGIQEQALATGFDATSGFPTGDVYLQTRCGGSGRGGGYHTTTYSAWVGVTWDYTGTMVSFVRLTAAPTVDATFSAFDTFGNEVANALTAVNVQPSSCTVENTTYCTYRAYLTLAAGFVPPPRVTSMSVTSGPATGGTTVTISGTGFTGATAVDFGTQAASFTVNSDTSITAISPAATAGTVDVTVTTPGGTSVTSASDQFTFVGVPVVSGISPDSGTVDGGTLVTITGANFTDVIGVDFGESPAGFTVNDDASITALSPPAEAPDTVSITVVTLGGTSVATAAAEFTYTAFTATSTCGDGTLDPGEQCDDGAANGQPGNCCSFTCTFQPPGTACTDDGSLCTADLCDGVGTCIHPAAPSLTCTPPDVVMGASLLMRAAPGGNQVLFKWGNGPVVPLTDFGDPTAGDLLELCVYDETAPDAFALVVSGAPSVGGGAVWTAGPTGWKFKSATAAPDGITGVSLKAGAIPLVAKVQVKAKNVPALSSLALQKNPSVVAQVQSSLGTCWGATFSTPTVSTATEFKAKSD